MRKPAIRLLARRRGDLEFLGSLQPKVLVAPLRTDLL
jgi:hypothetical protein